MNRPDLIKRYTEETGTCLELLDKLLDFTKTNLEVLKYIEWLEQSREIEEIQNTDYVQETANKVIQFRFINEVKSRMTGIELLNYEVYEKMLQEVSPNLYSYFLELLETSSMQEIKYTWCNLIKVKLNEKAIT
jgi:hypothetical protein